MKKAREKCNIIMRDGLKQKECKRYVLDKDEEEDAEVVVVDRELIMSIIKKEEQRQT